MLFTVPGEVAVVAGAIILVIVILDLVGTTVSVAGGAGPIARWVSRGLWRGAIWLHRRRRNHGLLRASGPLIVFTILTVWVLMLIGGWSLVFLTGDSLLLVEGEEPIPTVGRLYFAAATVLGRGASTFEPSSNLWRTMEQIAAGTGVGLVGLSIAYIIPIVSATAYKRHVATYISSLGGSPDEILTRAWNGRDFGDLNLHLLALTPMVAQMAQQHLAYPVLHYFHSADRSTAIGPSVVVLDEALTLLERAIEPEHRMDPTATRPLRGAIDAFYNTLTRAPVELADEPLEIPPLAGYRATDLPLQDPDETEDFYSELTDRRRLLRGFLDHDGWTPLEATTIHPEPPGEGLPNDFDKGAFEGMSTDEIEQVDDLSTRELKVLRDEEGDEPEEEDGP